MNDLQFSAGLAGRYKGGTQIARVLSEDWAARNAYCPACGNDRLQQSFNNAPVRDFVCESCYEVYELKSKKGKLGRKQVDGAYDTMLARLRSDTNPSFFLLSYDARSMSVTDLLLVPKHFVVADLVEPKKPLPLTAKRAGWKGCNILIGSLPSTGRIPLIRDRVIRPKHEVLSEWRATSFLRTRAGGDARGWLINVMRCIEKIGKEFSLQELYIFEQYLGTIYPGNRHIRAKIRQQLQVLRDNGYLMFKGRGQYEIASRPR